MHKNTKLQSVLIKHFGLKIAITQTQSIFDLKFGELKTLWDGHQHGSPFSKYENSSQTHFGDKSIQLKLHHFSASICSTYNFQIKHPVIINKIQMFIHWAWLNGLPSF